MFGSQLLPLSMNDKENTLHCLNNMERQLVTVAMNNVNIYLIKIQMKGGKVYVCYTTMCITIQVGRM